MIFGRFVFIIVILRCGSASSHNETALDISHEELEGKSTTESWTEVIRNSTNPMERPVDKETSTEELNFIERVDDFEMNAINDTTMASDDFINGFFASFVMILTNEVLDKTFFIAVVLAMRYSRLIVYIGALSALALMTVLATTIGILTTFIPRFIVIYSSAAVMLIFGLKMFFDAYRMTPQTGQMEMEEVEMQVVDRERGAEGADALIEETVGEPASREQPSDEPTPTVSTTFRSFGKVFVESFMLTFLAEWGDRSQVSTVLLAATDNALGVLAGGVFGHMIVSGAAVLGGKVIANHVSARAVTIVGAIAFVCFSVFTVIQHYLNPSE